MKNMFPQYDVQATHDLSEIWPQALFVFDTNVLLSLYRYRETTRAELLDAFRKLGDRIWIPYHVALEFQRNRLSVMAEQNSKFAEVKSVIEKFRTGLKNDLDKLQLKKKHSVIQPDFLIDGFNGLADSFLLELDELKSSQRSLTGSDSLKDEIEELFNGRVGPAHETQGQVDSLQAEGEKRYKLGIPPGYMDADKEKPSILDEFRHGKIFYKRKFGDYIIWDQIVNKAKLEKLNAVVFVTDDVKEDWWCRINADGPKTIGPRPELVEEIRLDGGVSEFLMYTTESFLKHAGQHLQTQVSADTLLEIRDVSSVSKLRHRTRSQKKRLDNVHATIQKWIGETSQVKVTPGFAPDFTGELNGESYAIDVIKLIAEQDIESAVEFIELHNEISDAKKYDHYTVIFAVSDFSLVSTLWSSIQSYDYLPSINKFRAIVGVIEGSEFRKIFDDVFDPNSPL